MPLDRLLNPTGFSVLTYSFIGIGEDEKENSYYLQDKPKEVVIMTLLQHAIRGKCDTTNSEPFYDKPVAVFPNGEKQEISKAIC